MSLGSGGGHGSGGVSYPAYMQDFHESMLDLAIDPDAYVVDASDNVLQDRILNAGGAYPNPYTNANAVDPDLYFGDFTAPALTYLRDFFEDNYSAYVLGNTSTPQTHWGAIVDAVVAKLDTVVTDADSVDEAVTVYEQQATYPYLRSVNRFTAGMADINATMSSAFVVGMALLETQFNTDINSYRAQISLQTRRERVLAVIQSVTSIIGMHGGYMSERGKLTQLWGEILKTKLIADQEQQQTDIEYNAAQIQWPLELFSYGQNVLGSIAGAAVVPKAVPRWASALTGAASGAAMALPLIGMAGPEIAMIAIAASALGFGAVGWATGG